MILSNWFVKFNTFMQAFLIFSYVIFCLETTARAAMLAMLFFFFNAVIKTVYFVSLSQNKAAFLIKTSCFI